MVKIAFRATATRDLGRLGRSLRRSLLQGCYDIVDDWGIGKHLTGKLKGYRTYRIGDYRIIYRVRESSKVEIVGIGHRKEIYERIEKGK